MPKSDFLGNFVINFIKQVFPTLMMIKLITSSAARSFERSLIN